MSPIRALVVDDEPLARLRLRRLLERAGGIVVEECDGGGPAAARLSGAAPDVVFLDVQMPETDGFAVVDRVGAARMPLTIFVTAYDRYALRAFDACALDYLLKPFDEDRFARTLARIRERLDERRTQRPAAPEPPARFVVRDAGVVRLVLAADIDWIRAAGNYVELALGGLVLLHREPLKAVERRLAADGFRRIHRSVIVNLQRVRAIRSRGHGDAEILTDRGVVLPLSRRYRPNLSLPPT